MSPITRRLTLAGAGALAAGLGIGLGWQRWRPAPPDSAAAQALWASTLPNVDGVATPLSGWRGQPTLVNFWATWCPPCVEEMPMLDGFYQQHVDRCHIIGIAIDQPEAVKKFLQKHPVRYPILMAGSAGLGLTRTLGNEGGGLPFSVFSNAAGDITHNKVGKLQAQDLANWLQPT